MANVKMIAALCVAGVACAGGGATVALSLGSQSAEAPAAVASIGQLGGEGDIADGAVDLALEGDMTAPPDLTGDLATCAAAFPYYCAVHGPGCLAPPGGAPLGFWCTPWHQGVCQACATQDAASP
jgi:hypothetical protein